jgi:hypothetical protein
MQLAKKVIVIVATAAAVLPLTARECRSGIGFNIGAWGPCGGGGVGLDFSLCPWLFCHQPPPFYGGYGCGGCGCGTPAVVPQPTIAPQTSYIPQTQIRREAYVENVPVTTFQPVTRTVYVPQQVTEMVPQTAYQPQMRYRDVAYQTLQPVVAAPVQFAPQPVSYAQPVAPSCAAPTTPTSASAIPTMPSITVSPYGTTNPVPRYPDTPSASSDWSTIGPRSSSTTADPTSYRRSSMFRPAPSAARVQQSPRF